MVLRSGPCHCGQSKVCFAGWFWPATVSAASRQHSRDSGQGLRMRGLLGVGDAWGRGWEAHGGNAWGESIRPQMNVPERTGGSKRPARALPFVPGREKYARLARVRPLEKTLLCE